MTLLLFLVYAGTMSYVLYSIEGLRGIDIPYFIITTMTTVIVHCPVLLQPPCTRVEPAAVSIGYDGLNSASSRPTDFSEDI